MMSIELSPYTPVPVAFLICDQVFVDERTKKKIIVGVFDRISAREFPTAHTPMALYIRLLDAQGAYDFSVDYMQVATQQRLARTTVRAEAKDPQTGMELLMTLPALDIPEPGEYEFVLWANGRYVHRTRFTAVALQEEEK